MANWYGISDIEFHFINPWGDPEITYKGVTDSVCVDIENYFYDRFCEEYDGEKWTDEMDIEFGEYMAENANEIRAMIDEFRAASNGVEL